MAASDAAVRKATGKSWQEWFALLDDAGASKLDHKKIAAWIHQHCASGWWSQMIAVTYEQSRGLRKKFQTSAGDFKANISKTFDVSLKQLFSAWEDAEQRMSWLNNPGMTVRKANKDTSLRITWPDKTWVDVYFMKKGKNKTQVAVDHSKLQSPEDVQRAKANWAKSFEDLREWLAQQG